uniref:SFRICE_003210 n=1 Tax=Spodoptera frugiperda TaxID=7108 RepID=A0A2H1VT54_SPOFR
MAGYKAALVVVLSILALVEAKPKCKTFADNVVCVAGSSDYELVRGLVSDNNRTTGITLRDCRITSVEYESFNDLNSLTYLDLSMNKIQSLKLGVIDEPKKLTYLNLSYNQLTEFPLGLFDQITNLDLIDLKGNRINKLELGIFDTLPKLKFVDLSNNAFLGKDFNPYIFDQSPHITYMDFSRNNMEDSPENLLHAFQSLETLNLDRCFLSKVPNFATTANLRTMKHLILSTNQIASLDNAASFVNLENLQQLDLTANLIETINPNILSPLKRLQKVDLKNNKISVIPDNLFKNLPKLITIDLYGNQLQNVPVNAFRGIPLKNLNIANNKVTYLQDNFCLELRNSGGKIKKLLFDPNPWQCACLNDLLKEVKRLGIEYNSGKYDGKRPVCVSTSEFTCKRQESVNDLYTEMFNEAKRKYFKQQKKK